MGTVAASTEVQPPSAWLYAYMFVILIAGMTQFAIIKAFSVDREESDVYPFPVVWVMPAWKSTVSFWVYAISITIIAIFAPATLTGPFLIPYTFSLAISVTIESYFASQSAHKWATEVGISKCQGVSNQIVILLNGLLVVAAFYLCIYPLQSTDTVSVSKTLMNAGALWIPIGFALLFSIWAAIKLPTESSLRRNVLPTNHTALEVLLSTVRTHWFKIAILTPTRAVVVPVGVAHLVNAMIPHMKGKNLPPLPMALLLCVIAASLLVPFIDQVIPNTYTWITTNRKTRGHLIPVTDDVEDIQTPNLWNGIGLLSGFLILVWVSQFWWNIAGWIYVGMIIVAILMNVELWSWPDYDAMLQFRTILDHTLMINFFGTVSLYACFGLNLQQQALYVSLFLAFVNGWPILLVTSMFFYEWIKEKFPRG